MRKQQISGYELPSAKVCMLVGNTKVLWSKFIADLRVTGMQADPLDSWTKSEILKITTQYFQDYSVYFVFDDYVIKNGFNTKSGQKRIAFQKLGHCIGHSFNIPEFGLSVTREFGPWFAYRAIIVFDDDFKDLSMDNADLNFEKWIQDSISLTDMHYLSQKIKKCLGNYHDSLQDFISIRREIGILLKSEAFEYEHNQMMYHYTKNNKYLVL